jgi:hypothetical protein
MTDSPEPAAPKTAPRDGFRGDTSIVELARAAGATDQQLQQLTPAARQLDKADLLAIWLDQDREARDDIKGRVPKVPKILTIEDIRSVEAVFGGSSTRIAPAEGVEPQFFDGWSCCCCTPCCCCAATVVKPLDPVV